ncbi:class B sortase [Ralstonia pickettii]|nr:class B sortase [Ralstonia pickettii]
MNVKMKKVLSGVLTVICLAVFIYAAHGLISTYLDYSKNKKLVSDLQETFYQEKETETVGGSSQMIRSGFDRLLAQNDELVGWITIEDTQIDYPILKADNNNDYLRRDFYKEYNILGSIFMDFRNDIASNDLNTIVYGHRTKDGSMFEGLTNYQDEEFFESHSTFTFDTLYESYEAEVFAVYITLTDFDYIQTNFETTEQYEALLTEIEEKSIYDTDIEIGPTDRILTLSTCDYALDDNNGRLVVQAKLVKKG